MIKKLLRRILPSILYVLIKEDYTIIKNSIRKKRSKYRITKLVSGLIESKSPIQIELGATAKRENWVTIDISYGADIICDITEGLPFPDNSVDKVYCSHLLEHFYYKNLIELLNEVKRILKPGGYISIAVPDASIFINSYFSGNDISSIVGENNPYLHYHSPISYINYIAYIHGQHKYMFDENELLSILSYVGFSKVNRRDYDKNMDLQVRQKESLYAIAYK